MTGVGKGFWSAPRVLAALGLGLVVAVLVRQARSPDHPDALGRSGAALTGSHDKPQTFPRGTSIARGVRREGSPRATKRDRSVEGPLEALLAAEAVGDPMEREEALRRATEGVSGETAAELLRGMEPGRLPGEAARRLFDIWAAANPSGAAAWAQGLADAALGRSLMDVAIVRWAATDLTGATAWARGLSDEASRETALAAVGGEAVRTDPLTALNLAVQLPSGGAQDALLSRAAGEWAVTDRDGAVRWAAQIQDEATRQRVMGHVAVASAEQDPVGSAMIALQGMAPGAEQDRAVVSIILRWAQTDPDAAADWVIQFPEGALCRDAVEGLVNVWADRDPTAAGDWLLRLPQGALRDTGAASYARTLERTNPELAKCWKQSAPREP